MWSGVESRCSRLLKASNPPALRTVGVFPRLRKRLAILNLTTVRCAAPNTCRARRCSPTRSFRPSSACILRRSVARSAVEVLPARLGRCLPLLLRGHRRHYIGLGLMSAFQGCGGWPRARRNSSSRLGGCFNVVSDGFNISVDPIGMNAGILLILRRRSTREKCEIQRKPAGQSPGQRN